MIVRGYSADERIVYGTGAVVATDRIAETATALLARRRRVRACALREQQLLPVPDRSRRLNANGSRAMCL